MDPARAIRVAVMNALVGTPHILQAFYPCPQLSSCISGTRYGKPTMGDYTKPHVTDQYTTAIGIRWVSQRSDMEQKQKRS